MTEHDILIDDDGIHLVYSDELVELFVGEEVRITRASRVEPAVRGGWCADMRPIGGPVLFADGVAISDSDPHRLGFQTRQEALQAERDWLRREKGL